MNATEFRKNLESLEKGDRVKFVFKGNEHWATLFLALFAVQPSAFQVSWDSPVSLQLVNMFMQGSLVYPEKFAVECDVLCRLNEAQINSDWIIEYLLPLLEDFIVTKPE